ncbi:MAG: CoA ester lyase [Proteobacteria bacterium]|nr:CoA ester lyase [Pseudomonadota bacterium]
MAAIVRPRRSVLYMPASNARALEKARTLPADGLILDLEDAVAPDAKEAARGQALAALKAGGYGGRELILRVNGLDGPWGRADLAAAAQSGADGVLLPKVEGAGTVREAAELLAAHGAPDGLALWCMIETPRGVLAAAEIAAAHPRLAGLVMGTSDLVKDLHARHTRARLPLLAALGLAVLAARAHGLAIVDGVHLDLADDESFVESCRQGRDLGFDGKSLIHPRQIGPANEIFAPSAEEAAGARRIIAAHAEAVAAGKGVVVVDGRLVENLHVEEARRTVALAEAIAALGAGAPASSRGH